MNRYEQIKRMNFDQMVEFLHTVTPFIPYEVLVSMLRQEKEVEK